MTSAPLTAFEAVSRNLIAIGAVTVDRFLNGPPIFETDDFLGQYSRDASGSYLATGHGGSTSENGVPAGTSPTSTAPTALLAQACQRAFSTTDAIKYECLEQSGPASMQCIITIRRPDGVSRSYQTQPTFSRKADARIAAAALAIDMGAVEFIMTGNSEATQLKDSILAPLNVLPPSEDILGTQNAVELISECCKKWRVGGVVPDWTQLMAADQHLITKYGSALRIQLSSHLLKVYSTDTIYDSPLAAKHACASEAVEQGVLEFIKFGNGQTQPPTRDVLNNDAPIHTPPPNMTLQTFFESLPKPFPEFPDSKTVTEVSPLSWLNRTLQGCRGGQLAIKFIWNSDHILGLHGCLLRVTRPGETRSFLVDPLFHKRNDAKVAVCILAISQGLGDYVRAIAAEVQQRVTPIMRKAAVEQILPLISSEASKVEPGAQAIYDFVSDQDAFGCTLTVKYNPHEEPRQYKVDSLYGAKADAKVAVAWLAYKEGVIELLRFRGAIPPPNYKPYRAKGDVSDETDQPSNSKGKRKAAERDDLPSTGVVVTKNQARRQRRKRAALYRSGLEAEANDDEPSSSKYRKSMTSTKAGGQAGKKPGASVSMRPGPSQSNPMRHAGRQDGLACHGFGSAGNPQLMPPRHQMVPSVPYFPHQAGIPGHYYTNDMYPRMLPNAARRQQPPNFMSSGPSRSTSLGHVHRDRRPGESHTWPLPPSNPSSIIKEGAGLRMDIEEGEEIEEGEDVEMSGPGP